MESLRTRGGCGDELTNRNERRANRPPVTAVRVGRPRIHAS